jgi:hypothetical protein
MGSGFRLALPLALTRVAHTNVSIFGQTSSLSSQSAKFEIGLELHVGMAIEYVISLPTDDGASTMLCCWGRVAHVEESQAGFMVTASIERYKLDRGPLSGMPGR